MSGPRRQRGVVAARQIAMFLSRQLTDASYPTIAAAFGGRDHTTVIHAVEKIGAELLQDPTKARLGKVIDQLDVDSAEVWAELLRHFPRQRPPTRTTSSAKTPTGATKSCSSAAPPPLPAAAAADDMKAAADAVIAQVAAGDAGGARTVEALALTSGLPAQTLLAAWERRVRAIPVVGGAQLRRPAPDRTTRCA